MGAGFSQSHINIYEGLCQMRDHVKRVQTLEIILQGPEYVAAAKHAGLYGPCLNYIRAVRGGEPAAFPIIGAARSQQQALPSPAQAAYNVIQQQMASKGRQQDQRPVMGTIQDAASFGYQTRLTDVGRSQQLTTYREAPAAPAWQVVSATPSAKALDYFQQCLLVLNIKEEVDLTEEILKSSYKKAALRAHPDKGGSEQQFEAVTRAFAYLTEILRRIRGTRKVDGVVAAPAAISEERQQEGKAWEQVAPVRLDPKNLNMNAFNQLYEQTRIPDPDDDGYGDWLKDEQQGGQGPKFGGKYNRDVFNKMFEDEAKKRAANSNALIVHPEAMALNSYNGGVTLGREKADSYTAPANASLKYTDLRAAYTSENTISDQVANVRVEERNLKDYKAQYKAGPKAMSAHEMAALQQHKVEQEMREAQRLRRLAQEDLAQGQYFERMKRLAITQ